MAGETELKRLYQHSRRGILELDVLLVPFVQEVYPGLDAEDQARFRKLLECEDQDIFGWLMQRSEPEDADLRRMVRMIPDRVQPDWAVRISLAGLSDPAGGEPGTVGPGTAVDPAGGAAGLAEATADTGLPGLRCLGTVPPDTAARLAGLPQATPQRAGLAAMECRKRLASGAIAP